MKFSYYSHFHQLPVSAGEIFTQGAALSMFLTREWFETLVATAMEDGQVPVLATVVENDRVLALLSLVSDKTANHEPPLNLQSFSHRYTGRFGLLLAGNLLAAGQHTSEKFSTDLHATDPHATDQPVCNQQTMGEADKAFQDEVLRCLASGLAASGLQSLRLAPVTDDDEIMQRFTQALTTAGFRCENHFRFYNWIYRLNGESGDDYLAQRPSQLRNTIARKSRKLAREHAYEIKLYRGNEVRQGLEHYHSAYTSSWKAWEQYRTLLDALALNLAKPDWTRLAVLYIDGEAAATQLWFVVAGKASIFRLAYDENWKACSPGSILTAWLMKYVIETDRVSEIDFLTGNEQYKQDWMNHRRECYSLSCIHEDNVNAATRVANSAGGSLLKKLGSIFKRSRQ